MSGSNPHRLLPRSRPADPSAESLADWRCLRHDCGGEGAAILSGSFSDFLEEGTFAVLCDTHLEELSLARENPARLEGFLVSINWFHHDFFYPN